MECICSEDFQEVAVAYCACKYPFLPLCKMHADKHSTDSSSFHFPLPLTANEVITSEEMYMEVMEWLLRLSNNHKLLRKKLHQIPNGADLIESAYQELLHCASDANLTFKQEFSLARENLSAEVEKAVHNTTVHALERYSPVTPLEKLLWDNKPREIPNLLFSFQARCVKEEVPAAFRVGFQCTLPGLEKFSVGERQFLSEMENPRKQLADSQTREINAQAKLTEAQQRIQFLEKELQDANNRLKDKLFNLK